MFTPHNSTYTALDTAETITTPSLVLSHYLLIALVSLLLWLLLPSYALATPINCSTATAAAVDNTQACELSNSATQDFLNTDPTTVNQEMFFGQDDWVFIKKDDPLADPQAGTWLLSPSERSLYASIMLIFKSGNNTTLVAYLTNDDASSGAWVSPFSSPEFNVPNTKDVSHISYYGRNRQIILVESSPFGLMLLGLAGLIMVRRRAH